MATALRSLILTLSLILVVISMSVQKSLPKKRKIDGIFAPLTLDDSNAKRLVSIITKLNLSNYDNVLLDLINPDSPDCVTDNEIIQQLLDTYSCSNTSFNDTLCGADFANLPLKTCSGLMSKYDSKNDIVHFHHIRKAHLVASYFENADAGVKQFEVRSAVYVCFCVFLSPIPTIYSLYIFTIL
eukprot:206221_1